MSSTPFSKFPSRRSTVYSTKGVVASTQPLANTAALKILEQGGNAIDAAVAMSAALCVTETGSTDIGGDAFILFYDNKTKKVKGLNGCGRSAKNVSVDLIKEKFANHIQNNRLKETSVLTVNVPGAIAAWYDAVEEWGSGKVTFEQILKPAIDLAENGYPISEISARLYQENVKTLVEANEVSGDKFLKEQVSVFLPNEGFTAPKKGQFMQNKRVAETLRAIGKNGKKAFYEGEIADSIIGEIEKRGGVLTKEDLASHTSSFVDPISYDLLGKKLWEIPPNSSGIIALLAVGLLKSLDESGVAKLADLKHNSAEYLHLIIEVLKLSFKDSEEYVFDHDHILQKYGMNHKDDLVKLLHSSYFNERSKVYSPTSVLDNKELQCGQLPNELFQSDTVYFTVSDSEGNAASFINSVFHNFGSNILVEDRGFFLQNRGLNFSLDPESKNHIEGGKRPYHTIIPGMITTPTTVGEELYASYGIQGGFNQPQAQVQVYLNMILFGLDPQEALDAPRISLAPHPEYKSADSGKGSHGPVSTPVTLVNIETGIDPEVVKKLEEMGHVVKVVDGTARKVFGRGQIIRKEPGERLVYSAGSDQRGDGAAAPFF